MIVKKLEVGSLGTNCYIVGCEETKEGFVVDPGAEGAKIKAKIDELGLKIKYIFNTHGHVDHVGANKAVKEATGAPILILAEEEALYKNPDQNLARFLQVDKQPTPDRFLQDGEALQVGNLDIEIMATPGHTPGGFCLLVNKNVLFSGDTLFAGSIGRTDLPGGSYAELLQSIKEKLLDLPDDARVYPGHMHETTIGAEKQINPFIQ